MRLPRAALLVVLLVVGAAVSLPWLVSPYFDPIPDASTYIQTGWSLLAGEGYSYLGEPFLLRPPGMSVLLLPVLATAGTDFWVLNLYVSCFGILCVALLYLYLRDPLGDLVAWVLAAAVWFNPAYQRMCNQTMSDIPAAALMLACLLLDRWARRRPGSHRDVLLGLLIAATTYVRTISGLLAPAIVLSRLLQQPRSGEAFLRFAVRQGGWVLFVPVFALLPWSLRSANDLNATPVEQTINHSYSTAMWHTDRGDPGSPRITAQDLLLRIKNNSFRILSLMGSRLQSREASPLTLVLGSVGILCLLGVAVVKRRTGDLLGAGTLLPLSIWFVIKDRLVLTVYLFVFAAVALVFLLLLRRCLQKPWPACSAAALLAGLAALDAGPNRQREALASHHQKIKETCAGLRDNEPSTTRMAGFEGWLYSVYLERPVYNLSMAMKRNGIEGARQVLRKHDIELVLLPGLPETKTLIQELGRRYGIEQHFGHSCAIRISPAVPRRDE
jgi:hypothetical protein